MKIIENKINVSIIVAHSNSGGIGINGTIPWKIKKDMAVKGLNNLTDLNKLMKYRYSDILIDTSDCYNFIVYLDSLNYKTSLNFYADKESVVLKKIEKQDTINDN